MAAHLRQLTAGGLRVVTLGLAGDFAAGKQGLADLSAFGRAAGAPVTRPGWIWGVASQGLSQAYDPGGTPDVYALISPSGHITYRGQRPGKHPCRSSWPRPGTYRHRKARLGAAAGSRSPTVILWPDG